jgi:hypothetical protein
MAAAAVVLLPAHFEEYIRQQVAEYADAVMSEYLHLADDFRDRFIDAYWRAGSGKLNQIRPRIDPMWTSSAEPLLRALLGYPVGSDIASFLPVIISTHDSHMRWDTITELTGRVGVKSLSELMFKSAKLKAHIGVPRKSDFGSELRRRLNDFYTARNGIVHSISQNVGMGATVFKSWAEFFRLFTTAFADALDESFNQFTADVAKRKAAAARE